MPPLTLPSNASARAMLFAHPIHPCKNEIENVFVRYMKVCALEKRGPHTLSHTHEATKRRAAPTDVALITRFATLAMADPRHKGHAQATRLLQNVAKTAMVSNVHVHLTRDYQVIETGNHYVRLSFCVHTAGHTDRVTFTARFRVEYDYATHHLAALTVCYTRDDRHLLSVDIGSQSRLVTSLPTKYLMDADYTPTVDRTIESCCIC